MNLPVTWKKTAAAIGLMFIAVYPIIWGNSYIMHIFILFFIWAIVAANWDLAMGYAGISTLGNVAFLMTGAYTSGILSKLCGWSPWLTIFLGGLSSTAIITVFIGLPSLRLRGIYIALLSMMFASALPPVLTSFQHFTGGAMGLADIPPLLPGLTRIKTYYLYFGLFLLMTFLVHRVIRSSTGLAFVALRDAKDMAKALGVDEYREKLKVFGLTSFMTGIAGGFYAHYLGDISPATLGMGPFLLAIAMMELGGMARFPGAILGAAALVFGNEYLRVAGMLRFTLLGALICLTILFFPGGLMELIDRMDALLKRRHRSA
jgi:branched-chain amino acid transport system permease protein